MYIMILHCWEVAPSLSIDGISAFSISRFFFGALLSQPRRATHFYGTIRFLKHTPNQTVIPTHFFALFPSSSTIPSSTLRSLTPCPPCPSPSTSTTSNPALPAAATTSPTVWL